MADDKGVAKSPVRITANLFSIPFGLAGLAACWQVAANFTGAPAGVADLLALVAGAAWLVVGTAWGAQLVRGSRTLDGELHDPTFGPFVALAPVVGMLLAELLYPHAAGAGRILFGVFAVGTVLVGGWLTGQWMSDPLEFDSIHPGYFLPTVAGGLIAAEGAAVVGWSGAARGLFGIGIVAWLILGSLIVVRLIVRPALPAPLFPTMAILLAPPSVAGVAYLAIDGNRFGTVVEMLSGYAVLMVVVQLRLIAAYRRAPFGPPTWSFTFSFTAAATLALRWIHHEHPVGTSAWIWVTLILITLLVAIIAARTVIALAHDEFLPRPSTRPLVEVPRPVPAISATD